MGVYDVIRGRQTAIPLTNKTGGAALAGDIVVADTTTDWAFDYTTTSGDPSFLGILQENINADTVGRVLTQGYAEIVAVIGAVSRGDFLAAGTDSGKAFPVPAGSAGIFGQVLSAGSGVCGAVIFGGVRDGSSYAPTDASYVTGAANGTLSAEVVKAYMKDNFDPDATPTAPNAMDDEFTASTLDVKWTIANDPAAPNAVSCSAYPGFMWVGLPEGTDTYDASVRVYQTPPSAEVAQAYVIKATNCATGVTAAYGEWSEVGIYFGNSTDDEGVWSVFQVNNGTLNETGGVQANGTHGTIMAGAYNLRGWAPGQWTYLKVEKTTTAAWTSANTYNCYASSNGIIWWQIGTISKTFTHDVNEIGIYLRLPKSQTGTAVVYPLIDFFRRVL